MQSLIRDLFDHRYISMYYIYSVAPIERGIELHLWARWRELKENYKPGE